MIFVLDATVAVSWCFQDTGGAYAERVLQSLEDAQAVVSGVWAYEVTQALVQAERRHRLKVADSVQAGALLRALPLTADALPLPRVFDTVQRLARAHGLSTLEAATLELGLRDTLPVATLSDPLLKALRAEGLSRYEPPSLPAGAEVAPGSVARRLSGSRLA